ncbi:hypothetical protein WMY93_023530 [Mugilogobius chulae]|uniref:Sodium/nucleoside cotransporter n=1 Tax=Mugilogobius chulae TaxID=88201 RepID=A0AAW0N900_9GOBI
MTKANSYQMRSPTYVNGVENRAFEDEIETYATVDEEPAKTKTEKGFTSYLSKVSKPLNATEDYFKAHSKTFKYIILGILGAGYVAYFITACVLDLQRATALVVLTCLAVVIKSVSLLHEYKGESIKRCFDPVLTCFRSNFKWIKWIFILIVLVLLVVWLVIDTSKRPEQLISFGGVCMFIVVIFLCQLTGRHSVMSILYFLGIMQWVILKISWVMQVTMGTSPTETLSVAGNIFVGQTEAPLLIRPYLKDMTKSEIHAVMVGGFATIAGSVMGAFISFGIEASSLISASVMAAPCALAISKLSYPETEESVFKSDKNIKVDCGNEQNILEAASSGASASIGLCANIAANLIAFLAILDFINKALQWLGGMVGYPTLTFELICSYIFMPIAFMMGIPYNESFMVAQLLGIKLFLNEFVAYEKLSELKTNRLNGLDAVIDGKLQWISVRSETITTYALCGFANFSSLGVVIGGLSSICPTRRGDISSIVVRGMLTGTCVSLVNANLFAPPLDCVSVFRHNVFNASNADVNTCCTDLFKNTVNNGTLIFSDIWASIQNSTIYFSECCQCCSLSFEALCK